MLYLQSFSSKCYTIFDVILTLKWLFPTDFEKIYRIIITPSNLTPCCRHSHHLNTCVASVETGEKMGVQDSIPYRPWIFLRVLMDLRAAKSHQNSEQRINEIIHGTTYHFFLIPTTAALENTLWWPCRSHMIPVALRNLLGKAIKFLCVTFRSPHHTKCDVTIWVTLLQSVNVKGEGRICIVLQFIWLDWTKR